MENIKKISEGRRSRQREVLFMVLKGTNSHPTADWIYQEARKTLPRISLGTVYRNLRLLAEKGEIVELNYGDGQRRFDGNPENHYHFTCQHCGKVSDVEGLHRRELYLDPAEKLGFEVRSHRVEFYGICNHCKEAASTFFRGKQ